MLQLPFHQRPAFDSPLSIFVNISHLSNGNWKLEHCALPPDALHHAQEPSPENLLAAAAAAILFACSCFEYFLPESFLLGKNISTPARARQRVWYGTWRCHRDVMCIFSSLQQVWSKISQQNNFAFFVLFHLLFSQVPTGVGNMLPGQTFASCSELEIEISCFYRMTHANRCEQKGTAVGWREAEQCVTILENSLISAIPNAWEICSSCKNETGYTQTRTERGFPA